MKNKITFIIIALIFICNIQKTKTMLDVSTNPLTMLDVDTFVKVHEEKIIELRNEISKNNKKIKALIEQLTKKGKTLAKEELNNKKLNNSNTINKSLEKKYEEINKLQKQISKLSNNNSERELDINNLNKINNIFKEKTISNLINTYSEYNDQILTNLFKKWKLDHNYKFDDGEFIIEKAINNQHGNLFNQLIESHANIKITDKNNNTLLIKAISLLPSAKNKEKLIKIILILIDKSDDVNSINNELQTPLHKIAITSNILPDDQIVDIVNALVKKGASLTKRDVNNKMPTDLANPESKIYCFIIEKNIKKRKNSISNNSCLTTNSIDKKTLDEYEKNLIKFINDSDIKTDQKIDRNAFININNKITRKDPLICLAAEAGMVNLLNNLLKKDIKINTINDSEESPIHCSAKFYNKDDKQEIKNRIYIIEELIKKGFDINAKDENGNRAVDLQITNQDSDLYKYLNKKTNKSLINIINEYKNKANLNSEDKKALSEILFYACQHGDITIIEKLINMDLNFNIKNSSGLTPLHVIINGKKNVKNNIDAENKYDDSAKLLIERGLANTNIEDANGKKVIEKTNRNSLMYKVLKKEEINNYFYNPKKEK